MRNRWGLTNSVAAAGQTAIPIKIAMVVFKAALTVGTVCVVSTVPAVTAVTCGPVQLTIKVALAALSVTVAG